MLKQYLIILTAIVLLSVSFFSLNKKGAEILSGTDSKNPAIPIENTTTTTQEFTSADGRIVVKFPTSWYVLDTTPASNQGQFGPIVQSWIVSSLPMTDPDSSVIPKGSAKIDFVIEQGGSGLSLESLLPCDGKTVTCERVGINSELFLQSTATLNTGMRTISVATFYDQNILRAQSLIQAGERQSANEAEVEKILQSIRFQSATTAN